MSGDEWDPGQTGPGVRIKHFVLDPRRYEGRFAVSDEMGYRMDRYHLEQYIDDRTRHTITRIERDVHQHVLFRGETSVPFSVKVPWAALIPVAIERTFWQRLFRLPVRYEWVQVKGRVTASGAVMVDVTDARNFPDAPTYPAELGRPIVYQSVELRGTLADHLVTVADGPHVADDGQDFDELARTDLPHEGVVPTSAKLSTAGEVAQEHREFWRSVDLLRPRAEEDE